jgi:hypothetical protein
MALTGPESGPPALVSAPVASAAAGALRALAGLARSDALRAIDGATLLGERAAVLGLRRRGRTSPGGSCRLLRAADGWLALNLPRPEDRRSLAAWLGEGDVADPWSFVAERVARMSVRAAVDRARLLALPAAPAVRAGGAPVPWMRPAVSGTPRRGPASSAPLVIDLSSLWAGPLCTHLLQLVGARVIKVESTRRPDWARSGAPEFFDLLQAGKESVALDLGRAGEIARLRTLLRRADIVVESARPRALAQLGIHAEALVRDVPGLVWVSLTGYGRRQPMASWVAFGDDAAAAAGLAFAVRPAAQAPLFCGDAIADPLAGLHAALAAFAAWHSGTGVLLDLSLHDVARYVAAHGDGAGSVHPCSDDDWEVVEDGQRFPVLRPHARRPAGRARPLGADTQAVLAELAPGC